MTAGQLPEHLLKSLKEREYKGLLRKLKKNPPSIDFCSNDYLGFSKTGLLARAMEKNTFSSFGSTGSRLISGNSAQTEEAEKQIAVFHNAESALLFNSGYDANVGLLSCVPQKHDLVLFDELIHASIHDGIRLSFATSYKFKHNSIDSLKELLEKHNQAYSDIYVVAESVYSMDGDTAPLQEFVDLKKKYPNVYLIIDEAHAIGVFGKQGRGLCNELDIEKDCFARIYTYGKAMGCHGAAVLGKEKLREYLINFSRPFIYTTALPPHSVTAILTAYNLLSETNEQKKLQDNINYFYSKVKDIKGFIKSSSAIHSLLIGSNEKADSLEKQMEENNIYARAIKSPTVKAGTERVRFCIHSFNTKKEIDRLISALKGF